MRRLPTLAGVCLVVPLALVLAVFAFENGLHSAHHAGGDRHTAGCPVASASLHLAGTVVEAFDVDAAVAGPTGRAVDADTPALLARALHADRGRAPPSTPA